MNQINKEEEGYTPLHELEESSTPIHDNEEDDDIDSELGETKKVNVTDKKWISKRNAILSFLAILLHSYLLEQNFVANSPYKYLIILISAIVLSLAHIYLNYFF